MISVFSNCVPLSLLLSIAFPILAQADRDDASNPIVHLSERDGAVRWTTEITGTLPIFRTRAAREVRAALLPDQKITVLEMDRFGFHDRGNASNGPVSGWTGWKTLLGNAPEQHAAMKKFRQRQHKLLQLIAENRPAIGMTIEELKLALKK